MRIARQPVNIRKRMERQEKKIVYLTDQLHMAREEYEKIKEELKEQEKAEIYEAYQKGRRSYAEVYFLKEKRIFVAKTPIES